VDLFAVYEGSSARIEIAEESFAFDGEDDRMAGGDGLVLEGDFAVFAPADEHGAAFEREGGLAVDGDAGGNGFGDGASVLLVGEFEGETADLDDVAVGEQRFALGLAVDDDLGAAAEVADVNTVLVLDNEGVMAADAGGDEVEVAMLGGADDDDGLAELHSGLAGVFALRDQLRIN